MLPTHESLGRYDTPPFIEHHHLPLPVMYYPDTQNHDGGGEDLLVGICLSTEAFTQAPEKDTPLGVVTMATSHDTVANLRSVVRSQIQQRPTMFIFLSKQGWPIDESQETTIKVYQILTNDGVVRLQRSYEKPRVGIITPRGLAVGFVFVDYSCTVKALRQTLHQQLDHVPSYYQFKDRNGWPVNHDQEKDLSVMDIIVSGSVHIVPPLANSSLGPIFGSDHSGIHLPLPEESIERSMVPVPGDSSRRRQSPPSFEDGARPLDPDLKPKMILISYVRAEASQYAVMLKESLTAQGYSVYLDVHEIKSGNDWQDALNFAVSNCQVFLPLVTPRYGETQWTNREVKLADVLNKFIVPVNFQDHWPPKCLAIQFATTQYIPWKSPEVLRQEADTSHSNGVGDAGAWDATDVARQIGSRIQSQHQQRTSIAQLSTRVSTLKSCPVSLPDGMARLAAQDREGTPLVVISIHPSEKSYGHKLKAMLEPEGYEVWCSTDLVEVNGGHGDAGSTPDETSDDRMPMRRASQEGSCFSLMSQMSQDSLDLNPIDKEHRLAFQRKADEAGVVIFVLSKAFAESKTSKQQVFYCEHRKRIIPLRYEEFCMPGWMSMLIGTGVFEDARAEGFKQSLHARVKRCLDPTARAGAVDDVNEAKIACHVQNLRKRIPKGVSVYISGGTRFFHKDSSKICREIGRHLAALDDIEVVTGGFFGVGEEVGTSYHAERQRVGKTSNIWHVLPERDEQDRSLQAKQNHDRTFPMVPYGKTLYSGDSVREREVIVSRVFDICILVEGGPGAAHEAEQFCWNDHVVIPVKVTGGAACGKFNVPDKIFKIPQGVAEADWRTLDYKKASPDCIGAAIARIVESLKERLKIDSPSFSPAYSPLISPRTPVTPVTPSTSGSMRSISLNAAPKRRRPSLTKMKTVRLHSQPTLLFTQSLKAEPILDEESNMPPDESDGPTPNKRCRNQSDLPYLHQ